MSEAAWTAFYGLVNTSLYGTTAPTATWAGLGGGAAAWPAENRWVTGYYYQTGFDAVKTACIGEAGCDWNNWVGYDGMLFVAAYYGKTLSDGFSSICFPNPVSNTSKQVQFRPTTAPAGGAMNSFDNWNTYLPLSCVGIAFKQGPIQGVKTTGTNWADAEFAINSNPIARVPTVAANGATLAKINVGAANTAEAVFFYYKNLSGNNLVGNALLGQANGEAPAAGEIQCVACNQKADSNGLTSTLNKFTGKIVRAYWNDCQKLTTRAEDGYWSNALFANTVAAQPPFCFGTALLAGTALDLGAVGKMTAAWTFIPAQLSVRLTTDIKLAAANQTAFNAPAQYKGSTPIIFSSSTNAAQCNTGSTGTDPGCTMYQSGSHATLDYPRIWAATYPSTEAINGDAAGTYAPMYKIATKAPVATAAKSANSLAMTLAAATVLATLF